MTHSSEPIRRPLERRTAQRQRTLLAGQVSYGVPPITAPCGIRNLSDHGAMIELAGPVILPPQLQLLVARDASIRPARVIWRRSLRIGLAFEDPEVARLASEQVAALRALLKEMAPR